MYVVVVDSSLSVVHGGFNNTILLLSQPYIHGLSFHSLNSSFGFLDIDARSLALRLGDFLESCHLAGAGGGSVCAVLKSAGLPSEYQVSIVVVWCVVVVVYSST